MDRPLGDTTANFLGIIELVAGEFQLERLVAMPDLFAAFLVDLRLQGLHRFLVVGQVGPGLAQRLTPQQPQFIDDALQDLWLQFLFFGIEPRFEFLDFCLNARALLRILAIGLQCLLFLLKIVLQLD